MTKEKIIEEMTKGGLFALCEKKNDHAPRYYQPTQDDKDLTLMMAKYAFNYLATLPKADVVPIVWPKEE